MRTLLAALIMVCAGLLLTTGTNSAQDKAKEKDKKEVVLKGKITCAKCDLGTATECQTVIVVKGEKEKKDITYVFDKASHGKFHDDICAAPKNGTVTGIIVSAEKKVIAVKKLEYAK